MSHHGWVDVINPQTLAPEGLKAPFGRLFASEDHQYNSLALALFAGPMGPLHRLTPLPAGGKPANLSGFTFLGQFIDHDLTEFRVIGRDFGIIPQNPTIGQRQHVLEDVRDPTQDLPSTTNGRSGKLDLDSVYGLLGAPQPELYDKDGLFLLYQPGPGTTAQSYVPDANVVPDIWRGNGYRNKRLIADPRNDENKLILQVHLLFERLHNKIHAARTGAPRAPSSLAFKDTRRQVEEVYRRIVLFDYLPRIVQADHIRAVLAKFARQETLFQAMNARNDGILRALGVAEKVIAQAVAIPVEFSHAVFRLGHTQLRNFYFLRQGFGVALFDTSRRGLDLRGDQPLLSHGVDPTTGTLEVRDFHLDWRLFFQVAPSASFTDAAGMVHPVPQHGEPLDAHLPPAIFRLPPPSIGEPPQSLAERNLRRGVDFGLPSGQSVAGQLADVYGFIQPLGREDLFPKGDFATFDELFALEPSLLWNTPLWFYMLQDAAVLAGKPQLGPVGGYIVAETLIGALLEASVDIVDDPRNPPVRAPAIAAMAGTLLGEFNTHRPTGEDVLDTNSALYWDKPVAGPADIFTMSQLVRYVTQDEVRPVLPSPCPPTDDTSDIEADVAGG
ncbi:peroxidase family protein [Ancylobacter sp. FA202]|uniref:peroxidase family protein n=1 Tax=Ancylobacter sp. FA202 TaxID=1111106 RepID=UPI00036E9A03|nr:peroxidase family protein [Ancylobacter sp. FA202]